MEYDNDQRTLTPKHIVDAFQRAYCQVYGREAQVVHMFAEWYTVNGETVHRMTLFSEISRLRGLAKEQAIVAQQQQEQFIQQQMLYAQQQAHAQYLQEQFAQQQLQFAHRQAAIAQQERAQPVQQQRQPAKPATDRSMIQRLISRLRGA